jgi:putative two-component system response regulator
MPTKQLNAPQRELYDAILRMANVAEFREGDNRFHLGRMRRLTLVIAAGLGYQQHQAQAISVASVLHDVGKIAIPDELLQREGEYSDEEWVTIERHTIEGAIILNGSVAPVIKLGEEIAHSHHERWDGSGYPQGLKGDDIPMSGRICALADVFDGLVTQRVYKDPIPEADALQLIQSSSGVLFDPKLVDVFSQYFSEIQKIFKPRK